MVEPYKLPLVFDIYMPKYKNIIKDILTLSRGDRLRLIDMGDNIEIYNLQDEFCGYVPCKYKNVVRHHIDKYELTIYDIDDENKVTLVILDTTYSFSGK